MTENDKAREGKSENRARDESTAPQLSPGADSVAGRPEDGAEEPRLGETGSAESATPRHPWEAELEVYPLREKNEDPRWAVGTVWTWAGLALFSTAFVLALIILGFIYD